MVEVKIPYTPRKWAKPFHESTKRWRVLVLHRRAGKSTACVNQLQKDAVLTPFSRFAYIAPTYKQVKRSVWDMLKFYAKPIPGVKFNEAELRCDYPNGSRISLYGADNADGLRGIALWGVVFDEYAQQPKNIFSEVISKCLADNNGYAIFIGTPKGKNEFYKLHLEAQKDPDWFHHSQDIDVTLNEENPAEKVIQNLTKSLADERKLVQNGQMEIDEFNQEWYISFDASVKGAYYAEQISRAREEGRITKVPYDENLPVKTWWDLGMGDATAIGFFQNYRNEWRMIDYHEGSGDSLHAYAKVLADKNYIYGEHYFPHDAQVRELSTGTTRLETAKKIGIRPIKLVPKLPLDDGINAVRMNFNKLWIDEEKCGDFIDKLSQYHKEFVDKKNTYKTKPVHDFTSHSADMIRYWATSLRNQSSMEGKSKIWIPREEKFNPFAVI